METLFAFTLGAFLFAGITLHSPATVDYGAQLQAAQGAVRGENGYAALYALEDIKTDWPETLPRCAPRDLPQCLEEIPKYLPQYQALSDEQRAAWQAADEAFARLLPYGHFREVVTIDEPFPPYHTLIRLSNWNAYRFYAGERDAALASICRLTHLGAKLVYSRNTYLDSMIGRTLIKSGTITLAHLRATLPAGHPLPAECAAPQPLPAETLSLCALQYGEWRSLVESKLEDKHEIDLEDKKLGTRLALKLYQSWIAQLYTNRAYKGTRFCTADMLDAVRRDEVRVPTLDKEDRVKHCSFFNVLCQLVGAEDEAAYYQARLLNANRYLAALDALRAPDKPLPPFMEKGQGDTLLLRLHREREDENTLALPLPGSKYQKE